MKIKRQILKNKIQVYKSKKNTPIKLATLAIQDKNIRKVKRMENVCAVPRNIPFIVSSEDRVEFLETSKDNSGFKRMLAKAKILQRNKISKINNNKNEIR